MEQQMLAPMDHEMAELQLCQGNASARLSWHLLPRFVLRSPGFPFDWLTRLRFPGSAALAHAVLDARERQAALQHHFAHDVFPRLCDEETAAGRDRATFQF